MKEGPIIANTHLTVIDGEEKEVPYLDLR